MKLKDDFYFIKQTEYTDKGVNYTVALNASHFIYAAHFPGNPVTPGACLTQMAKELTEELIQAPLFLKVVKNIKFTQVINPLLYPEVNFALVVAQENEHVFKINVGVACGNETFAKLSLLLNLLSKNKSG